MQYVPSAIVCLGIDFRASRGGPASGGRVNFSAPYFEFC
ncbi:hypothetical protein L837_0311 [Mycobacterium avium MAV_061107_1842]|nr:hypothetical protein L839_2306 [Mycobacterium avium MAV_120809_2495]ETZ49555.1 hypothetical protein L837_0311 [Mycobacterium avium MAV_061107_1842]ETZ76458.1 hypothetical protein L840_0378 [Mycobacterium sp. MAC_011194_8550]